MRWAGRTRPLLDPDPKPSTPNPGLRRQDHPGEPRRALDAHGRQARAARRPCLAGKQTRSEPFRECEARLSFLAGGQAPPASEQSVGGRRSGQMHTPRPRGRCASWCAERPRPAGTPGRLQKRSVRTAPGPWRVSFTEPRLESEFPVGARPCRLLPTPGGPAGARPAGAATTKHKYY